MITERIQRKFEDGELDDQLADEIIGLFVEASPVTKENKKTKLRKVTLELDTEAVELLKNYELYRDIDNQDVYELAFKFYQLAKSQGLI